MPLRNEALVSCTCGDVEESIAYVKRERGCDHDVFVVLIIATQVVFQQKPEAWYLPTDPQSFLLPSVYVYVERFTEHLFRKVNEQGHTTKPRTLCLTRVLS